ncbi:MAG: hypothetical protein Q4E75_06630, partial [bacterium]|nr:hypothetical protein [bacterium]
MKKNGIEEERRRKENRGLILYFFIVLFIIILFSFGIKFFKKYVNNKVINLAKNECEQYLKNNYDDEFSLEYYYDNYKSKEHIIDGTSIECGHDKNIKEYVFKVTWKNNKDLYSYITHWRNLTINEVEIKEVNGKFDNHKSTS